ncbi:uncharacterized protein FOBCDRAFT_228081, partial [Fusarium oxysporum Fo47]|uniref:uncharacterized protein n=1 Tax=Fusarium oxysporum Fo47 TaxID=660027 RepID=UPI002869E65D
MTTSMSQQQPRKKRTRASRPKVKTGCITCKIRHLKCDETKPKCKRCVKDKHTCDGYQQARAPRHKSGFVQGNGW